MPIILQSVNELNRPVYTDRERQLIYKLRVMLKDLPNDVYRSLNTLVEEQRGERWTDEQLYVYLGQAVADINSEPPHTTFGLDNFPSSIESCVLSGGLIFALIGESILQVGESFSYSDSGLSLNINLQQGYQSLAQMLLSGYVQMKQSIKKAMRPSAASIKSAPAGVKIRSYAPRMWVYR